MEGLKFPGHTGRILNVRKTSSGRLTRLLNVLCTFKTCVQGLYSILDLLNFGSFTPTIFFSRLIYSSLKFVFFFNSELDLSTSNIFQFTLKISLLCILVLKRSSNLKVSYLELFWAYRYIYLLCTWLEMNMVGGSVRIFFF